MKKAFTLTELLVVIGIIGILALIGIPAFRSYRPALQLSAAVRNLIYDLRYAQQLAVTEQNEYCLRFFTADKEYKIIQCQDPANEEILKTVSLSEEGIIEIAITGLRDVNDEKEARYIPYGAVKNSEGGHVTLKNNKNATTTIDIRPSGFVKILD